MLVTRISYLLIVGVVATAAAAVLIVLRPSTASQPQALEFQRVVDYSRYGVVERIDVKGQTLTVRFREDFDTQSAMGTNDKVFDAAVPAGRDITTALTEAGVPFNGAGGLQVVAR
jgi:hypothetical protein